MSWVAQVRHVLAKDVRQLRWLLAAYVAVVALAIVRATSVLPPTIPLLGILSLIVVAAGVLLAAAVVQADSPTRSDAFWATHPFRPTALAAAKLGFALMLVAVGLAGQAVALLSYRVGGTELASLLLASTPAFGVWLLIGLLLAAVLRDLRSVLLAFFLAPAVYAVIGVGFLVGRGDPGDVPVGVPGNSGMRIALHIASALAAVVVLSWLYRKRDARLRARLSAGAVALVLFVTMPVGMPAPLRADGSPPVAELPLELEWPSDPQFPRGDGFALSVRAREAAFPPNHQLVLDHPAVVARLVDGTVIRLRTSWLSQGAVAMGSARPEVPGIRWLGERGRPAVVGFVSVNATPGQLRELSRGVASFTVEGRAIIVETRPVVTLPLTAGARATLPGERTRIESMELLPGDVKLEIEMKTVERTTTATFGPGSSEGRDGCAVVNEGRGEGIVLHRRSMGSGGGALVLPGVSVSTRTKECRGELQDVGRGRAPQLTDVVPDPSWFDDARLVLTTDVVVGGFPFRLEVEAPPPVSRPGR